MYWPKFDYVEVLPNRQETSAERKHRHRTEYGEYVRRQYGIGIPGSRGSESALMRLSGDCSGGEAFKSRSINVRQDFPVRAHRESEVVKKLFAKPEAPGTPRVEVPKEAPSVTAGGETGEVCAVSSTRLNSVADETVTPECSVETPPVERQASVDRVDVEIDANQEEEFSTCDAEDDRWFGSELPQFNSSGDSEDLKSSITEECPVETLPVEEINQIVEEFSTCETEVEHLFGSELPQFDNSGDSEDLLVKTTEDLKSSITVESSVETPPVVKEFKTCDTEYDPWFGSGILWFEASGASEDLLVGTSGEDLKSSTDDDVGNLGEDRFDSTPEGSEQKVTKEARFRIVATKLSRESLLWVKDIIRDSLEWMITAVDWFVGRSQFGFIDNFGGFRK